MSSIKKVRAVLEAAAIRRARAERFLHDSLSLRDLIRTGLSRQRTYLLWSIALTLTHILEIWVLIRFHYAYPPSSGLTVLRVVSGLSLMGLFAALAFRWADFDMQGAEHGKTVIASRLPRLVESARFLFATGLAVSVGLSLYLVFFSRLQLSSPPAFRAVVLCGIIALPIEVTASFLLYLSGSVLALPVSRKLRWLAVGGTILSLGFLALDLPLAYLFFALTPRILLLKHCWKNVTGDRLFSVLRLPYHLRIEELAFARIFRSCFFRSTVLQLILDGGFLLMFNRLSKFGAGLSLLLYLVHKAAHLGTVLLGKTHLSFSREIKAAVLTGEKKRLYYLLRTLAILSAFFALLSFVFVPLFLAQRETLHWLSPTGESLSIAWPILLLGVFLGFNRLVMSLSAMFSLYRRRLQSAWPVVVFALGSLAVYLYTPSLVRYLRFDSAMLLNSGLDGIFALLMLATTFHSIIRRETVRTGIAGEGKGYSLQPFEKILSSIADPINTKACGVYAAVFFRGRRWDSAQIVTQLGDVIASEDILATWGSSTLFILARRKNSEELPEMRLSLLRKLAGEVSSLEFCQHRGEAPLEFLEKLLKSRDAPCTLYEMATARKPAPATFDSSRALSFLLGNREDLEATRLDLSLICAGDGWNFAGVPDLEARKLARQYLRILCQREEYLCPEISNRRHLKGVLHVNSGGRPSLLIQLPNEQRESHAALRYETFKMNLLDFLGLPNGNPPGYRSVQESTGASR